MSNRNNRRSENNIERTKEFINKYNFILKNQYNDNLPEDQPFFFNLEFNDNNELLLLLYYYYSYYIYA
jgi:hypothetical protein